MCIYDNVTFCVKQYVRLTCKNKFKKNMACEKTFFDQLATIFDIILKKSGKIHFKSFVKKIFMYPTYLDTYIFTMLLYDEFANYNRQRVSFPCKVL